MDLRETVGHKQVLPDSEEARLLFLERGVRAGCICYGFHLPLVPSSQLLKQQAREV